MRKAVLHWEDLMFLELEHLQQFRFFVEFTDSERYDNFV